MELFQDQTNYVCIVLYLPDRCFILGYCYLDRNVAAAIGIYQMRKLPQNLVLNLNYIPILNPDIVTGISLMVLFIFMKMNLGFATMLLPTLPSIFPMLYCPFCPN
jgi:hypothetical protein